MPILGEKEEDTLLQSGLQSSRVWKKAAGHSAGGKRGTKYRPRWALSRKEKTGSELSPKCPCGFPEDEDPVPHPSFPGCSPQATAIRVSTGKSPLGPLRALAGRSPQWPAVRAFRETCQTPNTHVKIPITSTQWTPRVSLPSVLRLITKAILLYRSLKSSSDF